jgi:putative NADPH-quinone reductase
MLVIYAHPNKEGHNGFFLQAVERESRRRGWELEVIDLYQIDYDPVLKSQEHYTSGNKKISRQNLEFQQKIRRSSRIVVIFPHWWQGPPAILKGFFDRVLTPGFAFKYKGVFPKRFLKGKKAIVLSSSGTPRWVNWLFYQDRGLRAVTRNTLAFCGIKTKGYLVGSARKISAKQKQKIDELVRRGMDFLQ